MRKPLKNRAKLWKLIGSSGGRESYVRVYAITKEAAIARAKRFGFEATSCELAEPTK